MQSRVATTSSATRPSEPYGRLRPRESAPPASLSRFTTHDLADALLDRLRRGDSLTELSARVELFALLDFELEQRLDRHENRFSRTYASNLFKMYYGWPRGAGLPIAGSTFLELGCGALHPFASATLFTLLGARRAIAVDLTPIQRRDVAARAVARCAAWLLVDPRLVLDDLPVTREEIVGRLERSGLDLARLASGDLAGLDGSGMEFRHEAAHHLLLEDASVDCVTSNSFLEHVAEVDATIAETARVTRRGGFGCHCIDGADHDSFDDPTRHPLAFLAVSSRRRMVGDCNRIRPLAFLPRFERHGFEVLSVTPYRRVPVDPALQATFVEPFRSASRDEIEVAGAMVYVRRT